MSIILNKSYKSCCERDFTINFDNIIFIKIQKKYYCFPINKLQNAGIFGFIGEYINDVDHLSTISNEPDAKSLESNITIKTKCFEINIPEKYNQIDVENCVNMIANDFNLFEIIEPNCYINIVRILSLAEYMCIDKHIVDMFAREYITKPNIDIYDILDDIVYDPVMILTLDYLKPRFPIETIQKRIDEIVQGTKFSEIPSEFKIKYIANIIKNVVDKLELIRGITPLIYNNDEYKYIKVYKIINCHDDVDMTNLQIICGELYNKILNITPIVKIELYYPKYKLKEIYINNKPIELFYDKLEDCGLKGYHLNKTFAVHIAKILLKYETL